MNKLRLLLAFIFMMPLFLSANTTVNISLVNNVFDTQDEALRKLNIMLRIVGSLTNSNDIEASATQIKPFGAINVAGRGEDSFNDFLAEFLADIENREDVIDRLVRDGSLESTSPEIVRLQRAEREMGSLLLEIASSRRGARSNPYIFITKLILGEVAQASENEWGDTARRIQFYTDLLSTQECVVMLAEDFGLGMALTIKQNIEMRSLYESNQIQIIPVDFGEEGHEEEIRRDILAAVETAKAACGFRITESIYPAEVFNTVPGGTTTFDVETYWAGLPQFPITLYTSLEPNCLSATCAEGTPQTYNNGELPVVWQGGCYGYVSFFDAFFGDGLPTPNQPITLTSYAFLIDADGVVTNNSSLIQLECTYTP